MGAFVFDNQILDSWLSKKSEEILSKVDQEKISTEEMLILVLKAQTNHFHHMDDEFRGEFKGIQGQFRLVEKQFEQVDRRFQQVDRRFQQVDKAFEQVDKRFEQVDKRFEHVDKRFDQLTRILMWMGALMVTLFSGLYLKLIF